MELSFTGLVFWHWFALAVILGSLDVLLGANFFFIWCGLAAIVVGVLKLLIPSLSWELQFLIFGAGVLASLIIWKKWLKGKELKSDAPNLNRRTQQYIDQVFTLVEPIENGHGKMQVGDTMWRVQGEDLPAGCKVKVIGAEGVVLIVEKFEK
jgi:inner membrane protein